MVSLQREKSLSCKTDFGGFGIYSLGHPLSLYILHYYASLMSLLGLEVSGQCDSV